MTTTRELTASEQQWLQVRAYLQQHRYELGVRAAGEYPDDARVAGTPLLTSPRWRSAAPIPLEDIDLDFRPGPDVPRASEVIDAAASILPKRADGTRYRRYSGVIGELAAPAVFENRGTYRLLEADLTGPRGRLVFGCGHYFDGIDTGEAAAHEYAAAQSGLAPAGLRVVIGDPCDPARRPVNLAISTLTLRHDRSSGRAQYLLHWRDPAKVGHAGGLYQVVPVGIFQPSGTASWNERNDFSLWRCMLREFAEELAGRGEDYGSERAAIDYDAWPFARQMTKALGRGEIRVYCLGLGVDPLTFATDLLTVAVIDAPVFDELFGDLVSDHLFAESPKANAEGMVLATRPFGQPTLAETVDRHPMQAAGAAVLKLAWAHRGILIG